MRPHDLNRAIARWMAIDLESRHAGLDKHLNVVDNSFDTVAALLG
jgi:hypothetical protein